MEKNNNVCTDQTTSEVNDELDQFVKSDYSEKTVLTDEQLDQVVETLGDEVPDGAIDMRKLKEEVQVNEDAELVSESVDIPEEPNPIDLIAAQVEDITDKDIYDPESDTKSQEKVAEDAKDKFNLTDEEALQMLETMQKLKDNPKYPVYNNLPENIQSMIRDLAIENNIPRSEWNAVARIMLNEMVSDTSMQSAMIDLEKSLNQALSLPSISDMYSEHTRDVMEKYIPETIEKIKDEHPEKAETLGKVRDAFAKSYNFSFAKEEYAKNAAVRKAIRNANKPKELKKILNDFNFVNEKSKFKMNDVTEIPEILLNVVSSERHIDEDKYFVPEYVTKAIDSVKDGTYTGTPRYIPHYDGGIYAYIDLHNEHNKTQIISKENPLYEFTWVPAADCNKFCALIAKSCMNMDPTSIIDATYMYYMMRNILMLKHTQEAKTDFAAELISNIIETISFITDEEAKFNGNNQGKPVSK